MARATTSVICLLLLGGCSFFRNAPESRATRFIETLVTDSGNAQRLGALADVPPGQDPATVVQGLSSQVALDYVRTRRRQGEKQDFTIDSVRLHGKARLEVTVIVSRVGDKLNNPESVRFRVVLKNVSGRGWLVTAVAAE
ncbi:MAG: hypothetical protein ACYDDO_01005 [Acidiferrobacterales bacterium]